MKMPVDSDNPTAVFPSFELKLGQDGIHPRGEKGETFIRPLTVKGVDYQRAPKVPNLNFPKKFVVDEELEKALLSNPDMSHLISSLVYIETTVRSEKRTTRKLCGSGALIQKNIVITCQHNISCGENESISKILVKAFASGAVSTADVLELNQEARSLVEASKVGDRNNDFEFLDVTLLVLVDPLVQYDEELLKLPKSLVIDEDEVVCMAGFPGVSQAKLNYTKCFPDILPHLNREVSGEKMESMLEELYKSACNDFQGAIITFGTFNGSRKGVGRFYYLNSNASSIFGLSGGPVIAHSKPDELAGIVIGAYAGTYASIFLNVNIPAIHKMIEDGMPVRNQQGYMD